MGIMLTNTVLLPDRFWSKIVAGPDCCWIWTGSTAESGGYGRFRLDGRMHRAHRIAYQSLRGPIPPGSELDHLCRVTCCVNPDHLEPVTPRENVLRSRSVAADKARQTHCIYGHEFTEENIYRPPSRPNSRYCRACRLASRVIATGETPPPLLPSLLTDDSRSCPTCGRPWEPLAVAMDSGTGGASRQW